MIHEQVRCLMKLPITSSHGCGLLNYMNSFRRGMFKLNAKFYADSLLYLLSHFECDGHTVHMLTQGHLLPPLTSTVKSSLFTHEHSGPLSLAARLQQCHANHFHYINKGWSFSRQTLYTYTGWAKIGLQLWVWKQFILVLVFINYHVIYLFDSYKPNFVHPTYIYKSDLLQGIGSQNYRGQPVQNV